MKTLLITPKPSDSRSPRSVLRGRGHEVETVSDVDAACRVLRSGDFELAVLIVQTLGDEAVTACRRLRTIAANSRLQLLAVGPPAAAEHAESLLAAGADDFLGGLDERDQLEVRVAAAERRVARHASECPEGAGHDSVPLACSTIQNAPCGVFRADGQGVLKAVNPALLAMLGYHSQEGLVGRDIGEVLCQEPAECQRLLEKLSTEGSLQTEVTWKRNDGTPMVVFVTCRSLGADPGKQAGIEGFVVDLSALKKMEASHEASVTRMRHLLSACPAVFHVCEPDGDSLRTTFISDNVTALQGHDPRDFTEKRGFWREHVHPDDLPNLIPWQTVYETGHLVSEYRFRFKDGTYHWTRHEFNVLRDEANRPHELLGFWTDITEHKQAVDRLRESESSHRLITENVTDLIWIAVTDGLDRAAARLAQDGPATIDRLLDGWRFTYVSPSVKRFLGYSVEEMTQLSLEDLLDAESYAKVKGVFAEELLAEQQGAGPGRLRILTIRHRAKDGTIRHGEVKGTFLRDEKSRITGMLGVTRDITERLKAVEALRKSEATLRSLFENLPDLVILVDREGLIQFINHDVANMAAEELVGRPGFSFLAPESQQNCRESLERVVSTREIQADECLDVFGLRWAFRLVPLVEESELQRVMVICTDITEQRRATQALEKEQRLLRKLIDLHERDRQLTAYEIHDGFSQYLTGALYNLQGFRELHGKSPDQAWNTFDAGLTLIQRSIDETRRLIGGLRPPILDESGVVAAVEYLACEAEESGDAEVEFTHEVQFDRLAPPLESAIFRIVQESLNNARHHSQSEKVLINLRQEGEWAHVSVRDWGVGFNPERIEEGRFGLQGMRERVRLFDGHITIETAPDEGTHIRVELPIVRAADTPPTA